MMLGLRGPGRSLRALKALETLEALGAGGTGGSGEPNRALRSLETLGSGGTRGARVASSGQQAPLAVRGHGIMTRIVVDETEPTRPGIIHNVGPVVDRTGLPIPFIDQAGHRRRLKKPSSLQDGPVGPRTATAHKTTMASFIKTAFCS